MKKRPPVLTIIALLHFIFPLYYTAQTLYFHHIPLRHLFPLMKILFNPFQQTTFFFLTVSALILGYGLYRVRAWAYWFFILYAFCTIGLNIYHYSKFGENDLIPPAIRFSIIVFFFLFVFYFIKKHVRAPYFNPRLRWWENSPRFRVEDMSVKIKSIDDTQPIDEDGEIYDMSIGGIFITCKNIPNLGTNLNVIFHLFGEVTIDCIGQIVWVSGGSTSKHPAGFGLMFKEILRNDKRQIKSYLKSLSKELER